MIRCLLVLLAVLLSLAPPALAESDYSPGSEAWNGLTRFMDAAREARVSLERMEEVDWSAMRRHDVLLLLHPRTPLDVASLNAFLRDGGRVIVADDFGLSADFLAHHGIMREASSAETGFFPSLAPPSRHFLFFNIAPNEPGIVGNHPAVFSVDSDVEVLLALPGGQGALIVEKRVGSGRLLALADPSMWINAMQVLHGNKQLAANTLRYLCRADPCRVQLALPGAPHRGSYLASRGLRLAWWPLLKRRLTGGLAALNALARDAIARLPTLLVLLLGLWLMSQPLLTPERPAWWFRVLRRTPAPPRFRSAVTQTLLANWDTAEFSLPARGILEAFHEILTPTESTSARVSDTHRKIAQDIATRIGGAHGVEVQRSALHLLSFFPTLLVSFPDPTLDRRRISGDEFRALCRSAQRVFAAPGLRGTDEWNRIRPA